MPDPISSSVSPNPSEALCGYTDSSPLTGQAPAVPGPSLEAIGPNACGWPTTPAEAPPTSAASDLTRKFCDNDHSAFIAASSSSPAANTPSVMPVLTVRPDQLDVRAGLPRLESHATLGNLHLSANVDLLNASAHLGSLNEDGSHGENIGAAANLVNGELTLDYKGWSLSLGVGSSLGGSFASGEGRDLDADGVPERCFKMTLGPFTVGECDEL
ncbi:MAG: hypothetical protein ABJB12_17095 [Pseudomonadota bacterium]